MPHEYPLSNSIRMAYRTGQEDETLEPRFLTGSGNAPLGGSGRGIRSFFTTSKEGSFFQNGAFLRAIKRSLETGTVSKRAIACRYREKASLFGKDEVEWKRGSMPAC